MNTYFNKLKIPFLVLGLVLVLIPASASAHQPRIVNTREIIVPSPEVSKAYYGKLTGVPDVYIIQATSSFDLYVGVLAPDIAGQKKDISAVILKDGKPFVELGATESQWKPFFEEFGHDNYLQGPEYKATVEAGTYEIQVSSSNNDSKYSLAIGEIEAFDFKEALNALTLIPELKKNFFNESPVNFILSPFGWGLIVAMYLLAFVVGFMYRLILKRVAIKSPRGVAKNIGTRDRLIRLSIGIALLLLAITTTWSPIVIFFSGFALFEALFSWCGFYAAIGKNTCPA